MRRFIALIGIGLTACATTKPCTRAGQAARDAPFRGDKKCYQIKDKSGRYVNHGNYVEYFPDGKTALEGQYKEGQKSGKWIEYDQNGNRVSQKYFQNGIEMLDPDRIMPPAERR